MIGGSTAAGAGLGGIFGGKKGALIGAAIGGGASTIYQTDAVTPENAERHRGAADGQRNAASEPMVGAESRERPAQQP